MYRIPYFNGRPLRICEMWPDVEIKDITDMVDGRLFTAIPEDRHDIRKIGIMGDMGFGKTALIRCLAKKAAERYGLENMDIIYENSIEAAIAKIGTKKVQFIVIDDASGEQNSRKSIENVDKVQEVVMLRHTAAKRAGDIEETTGGIVFLFWLWQYFMMLEKNFRTKLQYAFLKGYEIDHDGDYSRFVGGYADALKKNTDKIEKGDQDAKNYSLCAIPSMFQEGNRFAGRGLYKAYYVSSRDFPQIPDSLPSADPKPAVKPIDEVFKGVDQEQLFRARELSWMISKGMTQTEAGKQWDLSQPDVSKLLKWYRGLAGIKEEDDCKPAKRASKAGRSEFA